MALKRDKYNSRLDNIMNVMGLADRFVNTKEDGLIESDINYSKVNERKSALLKSSKEFCKAHCNNLCVAESLVENMQKFVK